MMKRLSPLELELSLQIMASSSSVSPLPLSELSGSFLPPSLAIVPTGIKDLLERREGGLTVGPMKQVWSHKEPG